MTSRIGRGRKKQLMDRVKCRMIDAALAGKPLFVVRRYGYWAIATTDFTSDPEELFHWKETYNHHQRPNTPTLQQALDLVDAFWDARITTDARINGVKL